MRIDLREYVITQGENKVNAKPDEIVRGDKWAVLFNPDGKLNIGRVIVTLEYNNALYYNIIN